MVTSKEQERRALEKIKKIISELGEDSYVAAAFDGCIEIAEENIESDFLESMRNKYDNAIAESEKLKHENSELINENQRLTKELDKELEWKPYIDNDNVKQNEYEDLARDITTDVLSEEDAKELLHNWFGFEKEKIEIINKVDTYEINHHGQLRKTGEVERKPVYNATDWNYIRFNCCYVGYELYNGMIRIFSY